MQPTNIFSESVTVWIVCSDGSHEQRVRIMTRSDKDYYTEERDGKLWLLSESEARRRAWGRVKSPAYEYPGGGFTQSWLRRQVLNQNSEQYEY